MRDFRFICSHCEQVIDGSDVRYGETIICPYCERETLAPHSRFSLGVVIDDFVLFKSLPECRQSLLFIAHQVSLSRVLALKLLKMEYLADEETVKGFLHEARVAARLTHPNMMHCYAVGREGDHVFAALEYIEGLNLGEVLDNRGRLSLYETIPLIAQLATALQYSWEQERLVHRDIKPGNILLVEEEWQAKLVGFRLARRYEDLEKELGGDEIVGSIPYLSPEALLGRSQDIRSDIYSLGATFYHLVTGQIPFLGRSVEEVIEGTLQRTLRLPSGIENELPELAGEVIRGMMAKDLDRRYQNAEDLIHDLDVLQQEF